MKITRVFARDFLSYQVLDLDLADLGLCLIEGQNQDTGGSNGSGKSSIFEAVVWCLFGKTTKGVAADEVIRHDVVGTPVIGETCVCVEIDHEGEKFEIYRHRKHHKHSNKVLLFAGGKDRTSSTDAATQKIINKLLRLDYKSFISSVMYPQKTSNFVELTDSERKEIFSKLIGTERFSEAQNRAKRLSKKLHAEKQKALQKRSEIIGKMDSNHDHINKIEESIRIWDIEKQKQVEQLEAAFDEASRAVLPRVDPAWAERIDELKSLTSVGMEPYNRRQEEIGKRQADLLSSRTSIQQRVNYIDSLPDDFTDEEKKEPEKSEEEVKREAGVFSQSKLQAEMEFKYVVQELERIKFEVVQMGDMKACETCGQELSEEAKMRIFGNLGEQVDELNEKKANLQARIDEMQAKQDALQKAHEQVLRYHSYLETVKLKADRQALVSDLEGIDAKLAVLSDEREEIEKARDKVLEAFREKESLQDAINSVIAEHDARQAKLADLTQNIDKLRKSENPYLGMMDEQQARKKALEDEYSTLSADLAADEEYLENVNFWVDGFGKNGIEALLFEQAMPALNERANHYLSELTEGQAFIWFDTQKTLASGETRDAFKVDVSFAGAGQNYKQVSGGEAQRVNLATTLALGDMCAQRSSSPVSLRLLDEPFEGLDNVGAEQVVKLLEDVVVPHAGTVLVMTHDENLKSLVSQRIKISKNGGISQLETA